ncbi:hypothetical protein BH11MYX1_BH11MYX1_05430 [soil metagenome]
MPRCTVIRAMVSGLAILVACRATIVDLGRDAGRDASTAVDAARCTCRITPCRIAAECVLTGGTCGADFYCTGAFGSCATTAQCEATVANSQCTTNATSTTPCP